MTNTPDVDRLAVEFFRVSGPCQRLPSFQLHESGERFLERERPMPAGDGDLLMQVLHPVAPQHPRDTFGRTETAL